MTMTPADAGNAAARQDDIVRDAQRAVSVHHFESSGEAYDASQCYDEIKDGDVLVIKSERVVGVLHKAWPVALTPNFGKFHRTQDGLPITSLAHDENDYEESEKVALEQVALLDAPAVTTISEQRVVWPDISADDMLEGNRRVIAEMNAIPQGVTVRKAGEAKAAHVGPRNLLEQAAQLDNVDQAALLIQTALGIKSGDLAGLHLDEQRRWRRIDPATRLMQIAAWLRSECFECMDLVQTSAPMQTVRTND